MLLSIKIGLLHSNIEYDASAVSRMRLDPDILYYCSVRFYTIQFNFVLCFQCDAVRCDMVRSAHLFKSCLLPPSPASRSRSRL